MRRPTWKQRALSVVLAILVLASGFVNVLPRPSGSRVVHAATNDSSVSQTVDVVTDGPVAIQFKPGSPSILSSVDAKVEVTVPADAAAEGLSIEYAPLTPMVSTGMRIVKQFQLDAFATQRGNAPVTTFTTPVEITFTYSDEDVRGLDIESLRLFYLDEEAWSWVPLASTLDRTAKTLQATTDHFSIFGA